MFKFLVKLRSMLFVGIGIIGSVFLLYFLICNYEEKQTHRLLKEETTQRLIWFLDQYPNNNLEFFKNDRLYRIPPNNYEKYEIKFIETKMNGESVYVWSSSHEVTLFYEDGKKEYKVEQALLYLSGRSLSREDFEENYWEMVWNYKNQEP